MQCADQSISKLELSREIICYRKLFFVVVVRLQCRKALNRHKQRRSKNRDLSTRYKLVCVCMVSAGKGSNPIYN